jgi:hypothetical protein
MIASGFRPKAGILILTVCLWFAGAWPTYGALLYKSYVIRYDRGWDILCDPYVVQKNEWVYKIFRQKGEISKQDFQEFLGIFKRLNPTIRNVDRIRPGQEILIPLKRLEQESLPGQSTGIVTVPFVTISKISEILEAYSRRYRVVRGDWVSTLVAARFGPYGTPAYDRGLELFKALNPDVENLDLIHTGQMLTLPDASLQNQPWYQSLFDASGGLKSENDMGLPMPAGANVATGALNDLSAYRPGDPIAEAAMALEGRLLNKGTFFFPQQNGPTLELDLGQFPMIELQDGSRLLFARQDNAHEADLTMLQSKWENVKVIALPPQPSVGQVLESVFAKEDTPSDAKPERISFSDKGVAVTVQAQWIKVKKTDDNTKSRHVCITIIKNPNERTPETIRRYLDQHDIIVKDVLQSKTDEKPLPQAQLLPVEDVIVLSLISRKRFVSDFFKATGYVYAPNVSISFPYAGVQVNALSNLLSTPDGRQILIDFEDLYGEAIQAIEKTGFEIIQIKGQDSLTQVLAKLLNGVKVSYTIDPTFLAAKRPAVYNTFINIKGFMLAEEGQPKTLLAAVPLHRSVLRFFNERNVKVIMTGAAGDAP